MQKISYTYCDSNVFLAYFNSEEGRIDILDQLFEQVQNDNQRKLVTSAFSIIEVAHVANEKQKFTLMPDVEEKFDVFWADTSLIELIDFHENLARKARTLMRQATINKYSLQGVDALHIVSAQLVGVDKFFTYDIKLKKFEDMVGFSISEPHVDQPKLL